MHRPLPLLLLGLLAAGPVPAVEPGTVQAATTSAHPVDPWEMRLNPQGELELEWDDLVPKEFNPDTLFAKVAAKYGITELSDDDPRATEVQAEIRKIWNNAPVVASLDGRRVRLPGLVVPLEGDARQLSEFLLVPYFGACIHTPPPPSNQIVYIKTGVKKTQAREMFEAVWVSGTLRTEHQGNALGEASYTLDANKVESYE